jgi:hypothetical protein
VPGPAEVTVSTDHLVIRAEPRHPRWAAHDLYQVDLATGKITAERTLDRIEAGVVTDHHREKAAWTLAEHGLDWPIVLPRRWN